MTIKDICKITNGVYYGTHKKIKKIKIDSRELKRGDLFIALKGDHYDGHEFVSEKFVSVVSKKGKSNNVIVVKDTYEALYNLSEHFLKVKNPKVIGITGSVGKTMTKELIYLFLKTKYKVLKSVGNKNNHIGVPLTLLNLRNEDFVFLELGMNHKGEIKHLSNLVKPDLGVITNVGSSHIGYLKNRKNIFKAKMEITSGMHKVNLVVSGDDSYLKKVKAYKCGLDFKNDLYAYNILSTLKKTTFNIKVDNKEYTVRTIPGSHLITNILLAIKVGLIYNVDIKDMLEIIESYKPLNNRMNIIYKDFTLIDDCYNSSYESLMGVLKLIKKENKRNILIIGDILELGHKTKHYYAKILKYLNTFSNTEILLVGENMKLIKKFKHFDTSSEVLTYLKTISLKDSIILVKGSRMLKLETISNYLKKI